MSVFLIYTFREPELLARTIRRLAPHQVVVHVDRKVDQAPFVSAVATEDLGRVEFLDDRVRVNWGGYSQVVAIRRLVQAGIARARPDEHLVLLSGQDYPITPVDELESMFAASGGKQFLRYFEIAGSEAKYTSQVDRRYHRDLALFSTRTTDARARKARNAVIRLLETASRAAGPLRPPAGFRVAHGVTHFAMTADFAAHLEASVTPEIERYFRRVFVAEEKFYQSLAGSSPRGGETGGSLPGGFEPYAGPGNWRYANLHHIDITLTKVYTEDDWPEVAASPAFFLRKLESRRSAALLDRIDRELLGVAPEAER
ncbi:hypothetical protein DZG00_01490 [Clavibacter lycopersici]|uniref:Peptide O-xylosyltransferase n=1 Tax=Clavibacter lycopersici TaxID=2301718 RepID=A0A399TDC2_9MICO|nr:beta-1,6-N-acetylglucosaminyltransferase [Clavibacter lycopersici]RIJ53269.1 hypothetical protein DZG00_01490 [Clavibacter lycopersici]RIJ62383.1 hypothetical protein DZG02_02015 [Clavibacter lycopersici]